MVTKYGRKKKKKWPCMNFRSMTPLIAHTFLPSFDNANGYLCQEILLKSRNFAAMVTWRHTSPPCEPFSAIHWRGTKPPCWRARNALTQAKQKAYIVNMVISFVYLLPMTLALQHGGFEPCKWPAAKGLMDAKRDSPINPVSTPVRMLLTPLLSVAVMRRTVLG